MAEVQTSTREDTVVTCGSGREIRSVRPAVTVRRLSEMCFFG